MDKRQGGLLGQNVQSQNGSVVSKTNRPMSSPSIRKLGWQASTDLLNPKSYSHHHHNISSLVSRPKSALGKVVSQDKNGPSSSHPKFQRFLQEFLDRELGLIKAYEYEFIF
jgi:hypothetical protein